MEVLFTTGTSSKAHQINKFWSIMEKFFGQTALAVSTGVLVFMNLVGNCLVLAVVLKNKFMRTAMNFLLFNLAVADIMVGVLALPVYVFGQLYTHPGGSLGDWLCRFITGSHLLYATGIVSAFTLSAVAYERYQVVVHPMTAKEKVTKKKAFIFITLVWVAAFSMWTVAWFAVVFDESTNQCALKSEFKIPIKIFAIAYASLVFGIPFISMLTLYGRVIWELKKSQNEVCYSNQLTTAHLVKRKITFMLVAVTIIFAICWGTGAVITLVHGDYDWGGLLSRICDLLVALNSSVNCILYTLFSNQFRKGLKNVFKVCFRSHEVANGNLLVHQGNVIETKL